MCRKVESSLHEQLTDHLNAEILAKTIRRCGVVGGGGEGCSHGGALPPGVHWAEQSGIWVWDNYVDM